MPPSTLTADIERLQASVTSLLALISHCQSSLSTLTTSTTTAVSPTAATPATGTITPPSIAPLALLHDTASLAKAHTTKLSLLLTQSSLSSTCRALPPILTAIQTTTLPPLLSTLQLLSTHHYGKTLHHAVSHPVSEILHGFSDLVGGPLKSMVDTARSRGARAGTEEPSSAEKENIILPCTGRIWGACDKLIALKGKGLNGLIKDRLESSKETLKDAEDELTAYIKRHSPCDSEDYDAATIDEDDDDEEDGNRDEADADDLFWDDNDGDDLPSSLQPPNPGGKRKTPILHPKVTCAIASTLKRIKTIYILFNAIQKARLTVRVAPQPDPALTTTPDPETVNRLDKIVELAEELVALVDEVVGEYYDNEDFDYIPEEVIQGENQDPSEMENVLIQKGMALSKLVETDWQNTADPATRLFDELEKAIKRGIDDR